MRAATPATLVALLAVLAGCGGAAAGPGAPDVTLTPAPVPTDDPTAVTAPGLAPEGVVDPTALARAHVAALAHTSYTLHANQTVRDPNGTLRWRNVRTTRVAADRRRASVVHAVRGPRARLLGDEGGRAAFYTDGERLLRAVTVNGTTSYGVEPATRYDGNWKPWTYVWRSPGGGVWRDVVPLLGALETRVRPTARDGERIYRVTATSVDAEAFAAAERVVDPRGVSFVAVVDERGVVRAYRLAYEATLDGERIVVTRRVGYTDLGETTVRRPSWYDEALNSTAGSAASDRPDGADGA